MKLYQIIVLVLGAIVAGLYIFGRITGKDWLRHIMLSKPVLNAIGAAVEAIYKIWPDKKPIKIVYAIMIAAIEGAEIAEKAWQVGTLQKEDRNVFAKTLVKDTLNKAGIAITPQVEAIVAGVIEAVCIILPHKTEGDSTPEVTGVAD